MIHIPFFLPLFVSGMVGALWREYRPVTPLLQRINLPVRSPDNAKPELIASSSERVFDDMSEIHHYQHVSWYALAFSASGWWFYPPATLLSIPLLSYNACNFAKTLQQTDSVSRKSPMAVFEIIGIAGPLVTGHTVTASLMFLFVFSLRNLLLQTRNLANVDFAKLMSPNFAKIWTLHEGVEMELSLSELQTGDIVVIHGGDLVLIEGKVVNGQGVVCQCSLQKKMKYVPKKPGDMVFPFTQLESGCLYVQKT